MIDYSKITEEEFNRRLNALPKDVSDFVTSMKFKGYVAELASAYDEDVAEDVLDAFGQVIIYALLGFIRPIELREEMLNLTIGDQELANEMASDVNDLVATLIEREGRAATASLDQQKPAYVSKSATFHPSSETRSFIPPKNDFLKPEFYGTPSPKLAPTQIKLDFNTEPKTKSVTTSPDIHPENVIDLKDLPR